MVQRLFGFIFLVGIFVFFNRESLDDIRKVFAKKATPPTAQVSEEAPVNEERVQAPASISPAFAEFNSWQHLRFQTVAAEKLLGHFWDAENKVEILLSKNTETHLLSSSACMASAESAVVKNTDHQIIFKTHLGQTALLVEPDWMLSFLATESQNVPALRGELYKFEDQKWVLKVRFLALQVNLEQLPAGLRCH